MVKAIVTTKVLIIGGIVLVVFAISVGLFLFPVKDALDYTFAKIEKKDLVQTVGEVGSVKSAEEIELNFLQTGRLAKRLVEVGEEVIAGQILAELDYSSLNIQRAEAISNVEAAQSNLNKIIAGEAETDIGVAEAQVDQARSNYYSALDNLDKVEKSVNENITQATKNLNDLKSSDANSVTTFEQAVASAQLSLENTKKTYQQVIDNKQNTLITTINSKLSVGNTALDEINSIVTTYDIADQLSSKNTSYLFNTKLVYGEASSLLSVAKDSFNLAKNSNIDSDVALASSDAALALIRISDALDLCYSALEYSTIPQATLDTYKTAVNSEITLVSAGILAIETAKQGIEDAKVSFDTNVSVATEALKQSQVALDNAILSAENSLSSAKIDGDKQIATAMSNVNSAREAWEVSKKQLLKLKAPARIEDINLYKAKLKQAQSALDLIDKKIEDSSIKSPIDGKIIKIEYEIGEQVSQSKSAIYMLANNNFEIEVDISESDIAKISLGDFVEITLDAFGEEHIFQGSVSFIEPAETVIQDVIYYKVIIKFDEKDNALKEVKSGMTANVMITADQKNNVLVVPSRAIVERGSRKMIRVMRGKTVEEIEINTGIRGDGSYVEIWGDVAEGDLVVTFVKEVEKRVFRY